MTSPRRWRRPSRSRNAASAGMAAMMRRTPWFARVTAAVSDQPPPQVSAGYRTGSAHQFRADRPRRAAVGDDSIARLPVTLACVFCRVYSIRTRELPRGVADGPFAVRQAADSLRSLQRCLQGSSRTVAHICAVVADPVIFRRAYAEHSQFAHADGVELHMLPCARVLTPTAVLEQDALMRRRCPEPAVWGEWRDTTVCGKVVSSVAAAGLLVAAGAVQTWKPPPRQRDSLTDFLLLNGAPTTRHVRSHLMSCACAQPCLLFGVQMSEPQCHCGSYG